MTWAGRRGIRLLVGLCVALLAGLTGAIVAVSVLSVRDRITLAGGIAAFVVVTVVWTTAAVLLGVRWWRWSRDDRSVAADGAEGAVLVAYGSREGGTAEIAGSVAATLSAAGVPADVRPAREVARLAPYRAVVLGGALYGDRWHADARQFTRQHARELRDRPVWLFASGPLATVASSSAVVPAGQVMAAATRVRARGTATFGGRLSADATGRIAGGMAANGRAGDFRDEEQIRRWALGIAEQLLRAREMARSPAAAPTRPG